MLPQMMNGQQLLGVIADRVPDGAPMQAVAQPFTTMWPSYYAAPGGSGGTTKIGSAQLAGMQPGDSSQLDDAAATQREREQRALKRKLANRESAKRSKLKRQQADRELQDHARRVEEERESLTVQLAAAQQRFTDAQTKQFELRRKIQSYLPDSADGSGAGCGPRG